MPPHDVICFPLLRWDSVQHRPEQLLARAARDRRVFYFEEPTFDTQVPHLSIEETDEGVQVVVPRLPEDATLDAAERLQRELIGELIRGEEIEKPVLWFYQPLALGYTHHLDAAAVVYDCMDDLAATQESTVLHDREALLVAHADLVLACRPGLVEPRRAMNPETHLLVSPDAGDEAAWDRLTDEIWSLLEERLGEERPPALAHRRARQMSTPGVRATAGRQSSGSGRPARR